MTLDHPPAQEQSAAHPAGLARRNRSARLAALAITLAAFALGTGTGWIVHPASAARAAKIPKLTTVQPVSSEDCGRLTFGVDGTFGPTLCPDGHPNVHAVDQYRSNGGLTIDLGTDALPGQVSRALCADLAGMRFATFPIVQGEYQLAVVRFRWQLPLDPSTDEALTRCRQTNH